VSQARKFELSDLTAQLKEEGGYFLDFLKVRNLEAGIIVLGPNEKDTQEPHSEDELYYVISGSGWMELGAKKTPVNEGSIIFVPKGMHHRFYGNDTDLVVLYMFAA
jgi:mannose-6-phosphate isomerase-like protein (cupin superfamily)